MTLSQFKCELCDKLYSGDDSLRSHINRFHTRLVTVNHGETPITVFRDKNDFFNCPICYQQYTYTDRFKSHMVQCISGINGNGEPTGDDELLSAESSSFAKGNCETAADDELVLGNASSLTHIPEMAVQFLKKTYDYHVTLLASLGVGNASPKQQEKAVLASKLTDAEPLIYTDHHGEEHYLLGTPQNIKNLIEAHQDIPNSSFTAFQVPAKRSYDDMNSLVTQPPLLSHTLNSSRYQHVQQLKRSYVELDDDMSTLINTDWARRPWLAYYCARIFEGAIIIDRGRCLILNCIETYGRTPALDGHFERFKLTRDQCLPSSLPVDGTRYNHVQVITLSNDNSNKLVIGTKTFNALATSTMRLDTDEVPLIGPSSTNGFQPSKATQIFLNVCLIDTLNKWLKNHGKMAATPLNNNQPLYTFDEFAQLRQLRSKFHDPSTYLFRRATSAITNDLRLRPVTIWTLANVDSNSTVDSDARSISRLFQELAMCVWDGNQLELKSVEAIKCNNGSKFQKIMNAIKDLFGSEHTVQIIGNKDLNAQLTSLANLLPSFLSVANKEVGLAIFDTMNKNA